MKDKIKNTALALAESLLFAAANTAVVTIVANKVSKILENNKQESK